MNFNEINCFVGSKNTGFSRCTAKPGMLAYDIFVSPSFKIEENDIADTATLKALLISAMINDDVTQRIYKVGKYATVEDGSAEAVRESIGDGGVDTTLYDGAYIWTRRMTEGGLCAHKAMRKFNKAQDQFRVLHVFKSLDGNAKYYIAGKRKVNASGEVELHGMRLDDIWTDKWGLAVGTTGAMYTMRTVMGDTDQLNDDMVFIPIDFDIADLPAISDVQISVTKNATGVFDVKAVLTCGGQNLVDAYQNILNAVGAWRVYNPATGGAITIDTVSVVGKAYRLTLDDEDADFVAATNLEFELAPISVTSVAPYEIEYIESNSFITAK